MDPHDPSSSGGDIFTADVKQETSTGCTSEVFSLVIYLLQMRLV